MVTTGSVVPGFLDNGHWSACFGLSLRDLYLRDALGPGVIVRKGGRELRALTASGGIPASRNNVVRDFLADTDGEWLWFIDTDMGFADDTVERLVKAADPAAAPVVGALAFAGMRKPGASSQTLHAERYAILPTLYQWHEAETDSGFVPMFDYPEDALVRVGATGAACLLIHRGVLMGIQEMCGPTWFDPHTVKDAGPNGTPRTFSEDLSFSMRVAAIDAPLHVDTSVKTTHHKGMLYLDEESYKRHRAEGV